MKAIINILLLWLFFSCKSNSVFILSKKNNRIAKYYKEKVFSENYSNTDTLLIEKKVYCIIKGPNEFEVGKIKNNSRVGKWFFYNNEEGILKCYMIKKYTYNKSKNIFSNGIYNKRW